MGEWISVNARLPEQDLRVLVCCKTQKGVRSINLAYQVNGFWHGSGSMSGVTHWMRLPELPKEKDSEAKNKQLLLQAKCEDGENIHVVTEWGDMDAGKIIGAFMVLGIKVGVDLCGENAHVAYEKFEKLFHDLQAPGKAKEIIEMMENKN